MQEEPEWPPRRYWITGLFLPMWTTQHLRKFKDKYHFTDQSRMVSRSCWMAPGLLRGSPNISPSSTKSEQWDRMGKSDVQRMLFSFVTSYCNLTFEICYRFQVRYSSMYSQFRIDNLLSIFIYATKIPSSKPSLSSLCSLSLPKRPINM